MLQQLARPFALPRRSQLRRGPPTRFRERRWQPTPAIGGEPHFD
jgi:hypothetical protein